MHPRMDKRLIIKLALLWAAAAVAIVTIGVLLISTRPEPAPVFDTPTAVLPIAAPVRPKRIRVETPEPPAPQRPKHIARKDPRPPAAKPAPSILEAIKNCKDDPTCGLPPEM